jgi:hypothetical protein
MLLLVLQSVQYVLLLPLKFSLVNAVSEQFYPSFLCIHDAWMQLTEPSKVRTSVFLRVRRSSSAIDRDLLIRNIRRRMETGYNTVGFSAIGPLGMCVCE